MFKKHPLFIFISLYLVIWGGLTLLIHSQTSISPDTAENIIWGMNPSFMHDKHPGLGAFALAPFVYLFPPLLANIIIESILITISWVFIYKLLKIYFQKNEAILLTILSALSFFYMGEFFLQYNQNTILLPFWCASAYYFAKALETNSKKNWILLAIASAFGIYAKFQIGLLFLCMLGYLILNFDKKYIKNIVLSLVIFVVILIPGAISLHEMDFSTLTYVFDRSNEASNPILRNIAFSVFDILFQSLNFAIFFITIACMLIKKSATIDKKQTKPTIIIFIGLLPYMIFFILELIKGRLPTEWLMATSALVVPSLYILFNIKIVSVNFKKLILFGILINLIYFISFNLKNFSNNIIEHNNIGDSVALVADKFIKDNHLTKPNFVSSNWKYSLYLPVFMKNKPTYIRYLDESNTTEPILVVYPYCNVNLKQEFIKNNYIVKTDVCTNVYPIDKFNPKPHPFSFYLIQKN